MKTVHLLKFKWLYNVCDNLETPDYLFIASTVPTLRDNIYGLDRTQIEKLDSVYEKYKKKVNYENTVHPSYNSTNSGFNNLVS